jgi:hypothetical protein
MQIESLCRLDLVQEAPFNFEVTYAPQGEALRHLFSGELHGISSDEAECYQEMIEITRDQFTEAVYGLTSPITAFGLEVDPRLTLEEIDLDPEQFSACYSILGWTLRRGELNRPLHPNEVEGIMEIFYK